MGAGRDHIVQWDLAETRVGGPFPAILASDVFVNCIYLSQPIPPFLTKETLALGGPLSVLVDVSCDITNPHNPLPVYASATTFRHPVLQIPKTAAYAIGSHAVNERRRVQSRVALTARPNRGEEGEGHDAPATRASPDDTLDVIAIDHLPTLLPREASERFASDLLASFLELAHFDHARVWQDALALFHRKVAEAQLA